MAKTAKKVLPVEVRHGMPRSAEGVKCSCGGYAESTGTTHAEAMQFDCGRYQMGAPKRRKDAAMSGYTCCAVAFECGVCGKRIVGSKAAPEMD